jgi:hypothetical protein
MTNRLSDEEINYRHNKEKNLVNIFKSFEKPIDFIWIDKNSRRRLVFQVDNNHNFGFFQEKSHKLNIVDNCEIAEKSINDLLPSLKKFLKNISTKFLKQIVVTNFDNGLDLVFRYIESPSSQDEKQLIDLYLDEKGEYYSVSSQEFGKRFGVDVSGAAANPEHSKKMAIADFVRKIWREIKYWINSGYKSISFGFSDDDKKNVKAAVEFIRHELSAEFPEIHFVVYDTSEGEENKIVISKTDTTVNPAYIAVKIDEL